MPAKFAPRALFALATAPIPAAAATTPIVVDVDAVFHHALSGADLPARIEGFERAGVSDFGTKQLDIAAGYKQPGTGTIATIYVFRAGLVDVPMWHDRIRAAMDSGQLGSVDPTSEIPAAFTPRNHAAASGARSTFAVTGKSSTATGASVFAHDDWLIVVRMTSSTLNPAALDALLAKFTDSLVLPAPRRAAPPVYPIQACADALPAKAADRAKPDLASALIAGIAMQTIEEKTEADNGDKTTQPPPHWCRDAASNLQYGVYRTGDSTPGYTVAFGDAGTIIAVYEDTLGALLGKKGKPQFAMALTNTEANLSYAPFKTRPSVAQVLQVIQSKQPMSSTSRPIGKDGRRDVNLNGGLMK